MTLGVLVLCAGAIWTVEPCSLSFDPHAFTLEAEMDRHGHNVLDGASLNARFTDETEAFGTTGVGRVEAVGADSWRISFDLDGPSARDARVDCLATLLGPACLGLEWEIAYAGPEREFFGWTDGLRFDFAFAPIAARSRSLIRWVEPSGQHDWEVVGDTPYPVLDRMLREVTGDDLRLVVTTAWDDADWFYQSDLARVPFCRMNLPAKAPQEFRNSMEIVVLPVDAARGAATDACVAALANGEPLGVCLDTGKRANLFQPGEPLQLVATVDNPSTEGRGGRLSWAVWDYYGTRIADGDIAVELPPAATLGVDLLPQRPPGRRGIYFLAGELSWPGGGRLLRTTLGVLPEREAPRVISDSPFGISQITADPARYPDQPRLAEILGLCARIGVHWIRGFQFPIEATVDDGQVAVAHEQLNLLRSHGIQPHIQCGSPMPASQEASENFRQAFADSLARYSFLSPYIEVGNEFNFTTGPEDYVNLLLKPQFSATREVFPEGRVMSMGLGGVDDEWWRGFVDAGGLDLVDVVSIHPGHHPKAPEFWEGWGGWVFRSQLLNVVSDLERLGLKDQREIWISEAYSPSGSTRSLPDVRTAADYLVREHCLALALGVRVIEWYRFQDGTWFSSAPRPDDIEWNFGIVYTDLTPKPQYIAYGVMTEWLEESKCLGRLDLGADDLYGIRFERQDGEIVDVLWSYREKHECDIPWWPPEQFKEDHRLPGEPWQERWREPVSIELPADGRVASADTMGNDRVVEHDATTARLLLTGSPQYVRGLGEVPLRGRVWP